MMALLDFSAAFDTVDHKILIDRMSDTYGVRGTVLKWFESYLTDRSYTVKVNKVLSDKQQLKFGVPQGSILGPILYSLYVNQVEHIAAEYSIKIHVYADDIQLYTQHLINIQAFTTFNNVSKRLGTGLIIISSN